jgi:hypothetical protein
MALPPNQMPPRAFVGGDPIDELAAIRANKGESLQPVQPMQGQEQGTGIPLNIPMQGGSPNMPVFMPETSWGEDLRGTVAKLAAESLTEKALTKTVLEDAEQREKDKQKQIEENQEENILVNSLQKMALDNEAIQKLNQSTMNPTLAMEEGGLIGMALGGEFSGRVPGEGHGMEDNVRMPIKENGKRVAELAVSPSEYVVDSHTMAALGNGNADRGADVMDETVKQIRQKAYGSDKQPREISGLAALKPLIERV